MEKRKKKQIIILISTLTFLIVSAFTFGIYKVFFTNTARETNVNEQENKDENELPNLNEENSEEKSSDEDVSKEDEEESKEDTSNNKENNKVENSSQLESTEEASKNNTKPNSNTNSNPNNSPTSSNNSSTNSENTNGNTSTTKPSNENNKPSVESPKEEVDEVDVLRKQIQNTYGITIKYGKELGAYKPKRLKPTILEDKEKIKKELNLINNELKKYPKGFFREFSGMPLTIYLVSSVPGNVFSGFTDREFMSDIKITLTENYFFEYTLNHEIMHYIDAYLEIKMYPNNPYDEYIALNPVGFNYGQVNKTYNYGNNGNIKGAYFISDYAQSAVREDRAELFKNMITRVYKPAGMFDNNEVLQKKALIIDKQIRQYFKSASGTVYWDKIIGK